MTNKNKRMKTFLTMFCIICVTFLSKAQTLKQVEYFIDMDKGVGNNTKLNLTASADSSYQFNIDVSQQSAGIHKLYLRTKDSQGKWSLTYSRTIEVVTFESEKKIIAGEYFFDKEPGYGKGKKITVSPQDSVVTEDFTTATASLKTGFHKLYTRFKDNAGKWSITTQRSIEIVATPDTVNIIAAEYFFTDDKGFGKGTIQTFATVSQDSIFKFKIPYNKIPAKSDSLFIRVQDNNGKWSTTKIAKFKIQPALKDAVVADAQSVTNSSKLLRVYPNPASQNININFQSKNKSAVMQIFDEKGKPVLQRTIAPSISNSVNISRLVPGAYIVQIKDGELTQSAKFVKQ